MPGAMPYCAGLGSLRERCFLAVGVKCNSVSFWIESFQSSTLCSPQKIPARACGLLEIVARASQLALGPTIAVVASLTRMRCASAVLR